MSDNSKIQVTKITAIELSDRTRCGLYENMNSMYLYSDRPLPHSSYKFFGVRDMMDTSGLTLVTIDAIAYYQKKCDEDSIIKVRIGNYGQGPTTAKFKLAGAVDKEGHLFILATDANKRVQDIDPKMPLRVTCLYFLKNRINSARRNAA